MSHGKIAAIVVTYNRCQLLLRCLAALDQQDRRPDTILLVNNASSDNTLDHLQSSGWLSRPDVRILNLTQNLGGAGGFAIGWEQALSEGAEWLWVMDDDGYPAKDCLEQLLEVATHRKLDAISPMQVDIEDESVPAFPIFDIHGEPITQLPYHPAGGDFFIPNQANLFNGLLIRSEAASHVGLPRAELFIRGDEIEYTRRMAERGTRFGTLASANFHHPSDKLERHRFFCGIGFARDANSDFKNYYMYRNKGLAFRENGLLWMLPFDGVRYIYYFLIHKRGDFHGLRLWAEAMRDGLTGKLGRHPRF